MVGVISTAVNYLLFIILFSVFGIYYLLSSIAGYFSGLTLGYLLNKKWTFKTNVNTKKRYFYSYLLVYLSSLVIAQGVLLLFVEIFGFIPEIGNIISIGVSTMTNFIGTNFIVFRSRDYVYVKQAK